MQTRLILLCLFTGCLVASAQTPTPTPTPAPPGPQLFAFIIDVRVYKAQPLGGYGDMIVQHSLSVTGSKDFVLLKEEIRARMQTADADVYTKLQALETP